LVPPTDAVGLVVFNSSPIRVKELFRFSPSHLEKVLPSMKELSVYPFSSTVYLPK
jgi:hypothetical protein